MKTRRLHPEEVVDAFMEHPDVIEALRHWALGRMSDTTLVERLDYLRDFIDSTPVEFEEDSDWAEVVYGESGVA